MNIGEKIKAIRKQKKMTLVQVAGDQLSKGMLSLIENGKAQPSMESLQYIAKQLQIDVSELLQDKVYDEISEVYKKVDEIVGKLYITDSIAKVERYYENMYLLIEPYFKKNLLHTDRFESIRLTELYYASMFELGLIGPPIEQLKEIEKAYEKVNAHSRMFKCGIIISSLYMHTKQYEKALEYLYGLERYIEQYGGRIDDVQRLNLYYQIAITTAIFNDSEKIKYASDKMLSIVRRTRIYYNVDDLYRFLLFLHLEKEEKDKCQYYLDKLLSFANILEEPSNDYFIQYLQLAYFNQIERDYVKVIQQKINTFDLPEDFLQHAKVFIDGEKAYAHIMLEQYDEAKSYLSDIFVSKYHSHPIDLSYVYRTFAMRGLCFYKLGDIENAKRDILYAMDGVKDFFINKQIKMIKVIYDYVMNNKELNLQSL